MNSYYSLGIYLSIFIILKVFFMNFFKSMPRLDPELKIFPSVYSVFLDISLF